MLLASRAVLYACRPALVTDIEFGRVPAAVGGLLRHFSEDDVWKIAVEEPAWLQEDIEEMLHYLDRQAGGGLQAQQPACPAKTAELEQCHTERTLPLRLHEHHMLDSPYCCAGVQVNPGTASLRTWRIPRGRGSTMQTACAATPNSGQSLIVKQKHLYASRCLLLLSQ